VEKERKVESGGKGKTRKDYEGRQETRKITAFKFGANQRYRDMIWKKLGGKVAREKCGGGGQATRTENIIRLNRALSEGNWQVVTCRKCECRPATVLRGLGARENDHKGDIDKDERQG